MKSQHRFKTDLGRLGERIYILRVSKKLTTKEIAAKIFLSPTAYRNIEKGNCDSSFTKLAHIAEIVGVSMIELLHDL